MSVSGDMAVRLQLMTKKSKVRALVKFSLVDQCGGASPCGFPRRESASFSSQSGYLVTLMSFTELEDSPYLQDDCIVIQCDITVIKEQRVVEAVVAPRSECHLLACWIILGNYWRGGMELT
ncbi:hypothetical protein ACP70R_033686 [Stipagrostis hirtigluma subsp. patula]